MSLIKKQLKELDDWVSSDNKSNWDKALKIIHDYDVLIAKRHSDFNFERFTQLLLEGKLSWKDLEKVCTEYSFEYDRICQIILKNRNFNPDTSLNFTLSTESPLDTQTLIRILQLHSRLLAKYSNYFVKTGFVRELDHDAYRRVA